MNRILAFDVWGDYAHFKKLETTTSPLTYSIPTGTVLSGLIAAILGYKRDTYYNVFSRENIEFAIRVLKPIRKVRVNQNLINTAKSPFFNLYDKDNPRTQIPYEYLRTPTYRIYVFLRNEEIFKELEKNLKNHKSFFTPYLGLSEHIANFKFLGKFEPDKDLNEEVEIHSVLPKRKVGTRFARIKEGFRWAIETIPMYMNEERIVKEYAEVLFDTNGLPIPMKKREYYRIGEDNVIFL